MPRTANGLRKIETRDNGKLIREMRAQMASLPDTYHYYAGMADKLTGETIPVNKADTFNFTLREPIGVVAIIVPWNSPLYLLSSVLAPCLAVGNTVVVKPAENTTASTLEFAALVKESGIPDGVFNVVTGLGETAGETLARHPGINKVAFTGGTDTGRKVARNAAQNLVPCTLELGGKSPHVVFDDSDPERAASGIVSGIFAAGGQTCIAGSRCFLQESVYDTVLDLLVQKARSVVIGDPMDPETQLGPLALRSQLDKVMDHIRTAGGTAPPWLPAGGSLTGRTVHKASMSNRRCLPRSPATCGSPGRRYSARCWRSCPFVTNRN